MTDDRDQPPVLEARGIVKRFGTVRALRGADFTVRAGEVVALIGDNGAGKSTLVKVLSGTIQPDAGDILLDGRPVHFPSPVTARQGGIETVYQDLALIPHLDAGSNLYLGREVMRPGFLGRVGFVDAGAMRRRAADAFESLGSMTIDARSPVGALSGGQRQSVAVARAVVWAQRVVFMDEPTAALGVVQSAHVLDLIREVKRRGTAVVLISHSMPEVLEVADRVEVLRLGLRVARFEGKDTTMEQLVGAMTGALTQGSAA